MIPVSGAELHHSIRGQGPTCLFLCHGGVRPHEVQTPAALSDRLRMVYVDLRGSGSSTGNAADLTFDLLARDLEAVRAHLGLDRVAVLGHSVLGMLALEYGRRCPDTVSHVIAVGTPPSGDMTALQASAKAYFAQDASEERKRLLRENLAALAPDAPPWQAMLAQSPMRFEDPRFNAAPLYAEAQIRPEIIMHLFGTLTPAWDVTAGASELRVPTFLALGRHDYVVPHILWQTIAPTLPSFHVHLFERSGHQPFFEEPEPFATAVTEWMKRTG